MDSIKLVSYIIAAAIPALAIYLVVLLDLFGTGKFSTVLMAFGWGAIIAFQVAKLTNNRTLDYISYDNVTRFSAPVVEEIIKSLILILFVTRPRFRYLVDGAVYGFADGIGFAVVENFDYISGIESGGALSVAISRVLSASLMHATASALVGIVLGRLRRSQTVSIRKYVWALPGVATAIFVHMIYNNAIQIEGLAASLLLLLGIGIGVGGSVIIGYIINQGLADEKARFAETLGLEVGVTAAERKAVQELGTNAIENILVELGNFFGDDKIDQIRRLLVTQANIGILSNNLRSPASERMKQAWQKEIADFRKESDELRNKLGVYVMSFLRSIFPDEDAVTWDAITEKAAEFDPHHVHKFDVFMRVSQTAQTLTAERLEELGARLKKMEIFSLVELSDLENLSRAIIERQYQDSEELFRQGDEGDAMFMIEEGGINIYLDDKFIRTYKPGHVVGDFALFDGQPRSATARAHGALRVLILRRQHVLMFVNSRPHVIEAILRFLAERLRYTTHIVEDAVGRASAIARGDYAKVFSWEVAPSPTATGTTTDRVERIAASGPASMETTQDLRSFVSGGPQQLGGAFAMLAVALERRETALQEKLQKAKASK